VVNYGADPDLLREWVGIEGRVWSIIGFPLVSPHIYQFDEYLETGFDDE
jgi:hypothetical protein